MARKQYGLKFEEANMDRFDAIASKHGVTRTAYLETAALLLSDELDRDRAELAPARDGASARILFPALVTETKVPVLASGERRAYICKHKDCQLPVPLRIFLRPGEPEPPDCPSGHGPMERQPNRPYFGQSTA